MKKKKERDKKIELKPSVKSSEVKERDPKGRFAKGHKSLSPGRPKGSPKDIICKDGKKRSVQALVDDLLAAYEHLGGDKFLRQWASHSHRNLARFVEILFKFAPPPEMLIKQEIKSLQVHLTKTITDELPSDELRDFHVQNLEQQVEKQELELSRLRGLLASKETKLLEGYPDKDGKPGGSDRVN